MKKLGMIFCLATLVFGISGIAMNSNVKKLSLFDYSVITDVNLTRAAIANGENVNEINSKGMTPLRYAIETLRGDNLDVLELLIAEGADVNYQSKDSGWTALHQAFAENYALVSWYGSEVALKIEQNLFTKAADLLIKSGARPVKDNIGRTPLMTVAPAYSWGYMMGLLERFYEWEARELNIPSRDHLQNVRGYTQKIGERLISQHNLEKELL